MSLVADIKTLLTGITSDIFLDSYPESPENIITIYHSGGYASEHSFGYVAWENPTFQVRIRNKQASTAIQWCERIKDLLDGKTDLTINSNRYLSIKLQGDILPLGKDSKNRSEYSLNFKCEVQRS